MLRLVSEKRTIEVIHSLLYVINTCLVDYVLCGNVGIVWLGSLGAPTRTLLTALNLNWNCCPGDRPTTDLSLDLWTMSTCGQDRFARTLASQWWVNLRQTAVGWMNDWQHTKYARWTRKIPSHCWWAIVACAYLQKLMVKPQLYVQ